MQEPRSEEVDAMDLWSEVVDDLRSQRPTGADRAVGPGCQDSPSSAGARSG